MTIRNEINTTKTTIKLKVKYKDKQSIQFLYMVSIISNVSIIWSNPVTLHAIQKMG